MKLKRAVRCCRRHRTICITSLTTIVFVLVSSGDHFPADADAPSGTPLISSAPRSIAEHFQSRDNQNVSSATHASPELSTDSPNRVLQRKADCWARGGGRWIRDVARAKASDNYIPAGMGQRDEVYFWEPADGCTDAPLLFFNRSNFCLALRGRNVYIIGDSITRDFSYILHHMGRDHSQPFMRFANYTALFDNVICEDSPFGASHVPMLEHSMLRNGFIQSYRGVSTVVDSINN